jgi:hypothetical protein
MNDDEAETLWAEANALAESLRLRLNAMYAFNDRFRKASVGRALLMVNSLQTETKTCIIRKENHGNREGQDAGGPGAGGRA